MKFGAVKLCEAIIKWESFIMTAFTGLLVTSQCVAQQIIAQYPLEVEGNKTFRFYDVSGNGNSGKLVNNSKETIGSIFNSDSFPNNTSCIRKLLPSDASINIPGLYKNINAALTGFTVSFWIYIDNVNDSYPSSTKLIDLPQFTITKLKSKGATTNISLYYPTQVAPSVSIQVPDDFSKSGWYFMSYSFSGSQFGNKITYFYYPYDGNYDPSIKALIGGTIDGNGAMTNNLAQKDGFLLDASFKGKIWNIKFFDKGNSSIDAVNQDRNDSWYFSSGKIDHEYADKYYPINNTESYYPCEFFGNNTPVLVDVKNGRSSTSATNYSFIKDRFGNENAALAFKKNGYATLPLPNSEYNQSKGLDPLKGYTISFWTYIEQNLLPPQNSVFPFSQFDTCFEFMNFIMNKQTWVGFL